MFFRKITQAFSNKFVQKLKYYRKLDNFLADIVLLFELMPI